MGTSWRDELVFDHAFILVRDLEEADRRLRSEFGLGSVHIGAFADAPGVVNRIIPMRKGFLELLAVTDPNPGLSDAADFWRQRLEERGEHIAGWAMRSDRLREAAQDLGLSVDGLETQLIDGEDFELRWSVVWPLDDPVHVPFLIQYEDFRAYRALLDRRLDEAAHKIIPLQVNGITLTGDPAKVSKRMGTNSLVRTQSGFDEILGVSLETPSKSIQLRWTERRV